MFQQVLRPAPLFSFGMLGDEFQDVFPEALFTRDFVPFAGIDDEGGVGDDIGHFLGRAFLEVSVIFAVEHQDRYLDALQDLNRSGDLFRLGFDDHILAVGAAFLSPM